MEIINKTLNNYCKYLYFWKGKPTTLGALSNVQLESIIKFINKYPSGLLNGYSKHCYIEACTYILKWRNTNKIPLIIEDHRLQKAESKANLLTNVILKSFIKTEKQYAK